MSLVFERRHAFVVLPMFQRLILRIGVVAMALAILRLPIVGLFEYGLLVLLVVCISVGSVSTNLTRWVLAAVLTGAVVAGHMLYPAPRIDEGFNAFLPKPESTADSVLPPDVLSAMTAQFEAQYPTARECIEHGADCGPGQQADTPAGYAFSADAVYDPSAMSRRTTTIGFSNPVDVRLAFINDLRYWFSSDAERFSRDKRVLNVFDKYRLRIPLFVVYRLPSAFVGSTLCWRGTVLWPIADGHFETLRRAETTCRQIGDADVGRPIFGVSILQDEQLAMHLNPNGAVQARKLFESALTLAGMLGLFFLLVTVSPRRLVLPAIVIVSITVVTALLEIEFIGGLRPLDTGDDGIAYIGLGRDIVRDVLAGNWAAALRGGESVYNFTPGFRYARAIEGFLFGDTFLGYFSIMLAFPFIVLALFRRFLPSQWALLMVLGFVATPFGTIFGTSILDYIKVAERGYADPLAFFLLFSGFVLIIPPAAPPQELRSARAFFGAVLLALATFCRPNLILAAGTLMVCAIGVGVSRRRWDWVGALLAGFAVILVSPLHNEVFGQSNILLSDNVSTPRTLLMYPLDYARAAAQLLRLDFTGDYVVRALQQMFRWLSGPQKLLIAVPIHAVAVLILARVALFGRGYEFWLRVVANATLLQHGIGVCYVDYERYSLGTWLLTAMVVAVWLQRQCVRHPKASWLVAARTVLQRSGIAGLTARLEALSSADDDETALQSKAIVA
jgi:hypothetical protein